MCLLPGNEDEWVFFTSFWLLMMQMLTCDGLKKMITTAKSKLDIWNKSSLIILVIS